jgi:lipid-A-disaccharide synthase
MESAGAQIVKHYRDLAFMGFYEVLLNIRTILGNIRFCKNDITGYRPDALILIDYPGFNLRIARWAHEKKSRYSIISHRKFGPGRRAASMLCGSTFIIFL